MFCTEEVSTIDHLRARGRERAIYSGKNVGGDIVHHHNAFRCRRSLNEEIQVNGMESDDAFEEALKFLTGAKSLGLKIGEEAAVLAGRSAERDANVHVQGSGARKLYA